MERILVTGGAGFIGSYVIENLIRRKFSVVNFQHATECSNKGVDVFHGDITDTGSVIEAVGLSDGVIHLAGVLGTSQMDNPSIPVDVNVMGSLNVFEACRMHRKKAVCISVGNYWMNNPYAITKNAAERFAFMYNRELSTQIAVVRAYNVYGPRQKMKPVRKIIPNFIVPSLLNRDIAVFGSGKQLVDMIFVEDAADILVRALVQDHGVYDSAIEAGSGIGVTVNQIAEAVVRRIGAPSAIEHSKMRPGEESDSRVVADIRTLEPLGMNRESLVTLENGLDVTIRWYRDNLDAVLKGG